MNGGALQGVWAVPAAVLAAAVVLACAAGGLRAGRRDRAARRRADAVLGVRAADPVRAGRARAGGEPSAVSRAPFSVASKALAACCGRPRRPPVRDALAALAAAAFAATAVGGAGGPLAGCAAGYGAWWWLRRRRADADRRAASSAARAILGQLPLTAELLAACLAAGAGPGQAAEAVGRSLGGPLGERLARAATELRLGGEPGAVWGRFGAHGGCEGLARCMERAGTAGVPAVEPVSRLAAESRARGARAAAGRARRTAVLVTGPLGLCFLPAFLAVGVAPVVMGLADSLL